MRKIKLSKLEQRAIWNLIDRHIKDEGEVDLIAVNKELNEPYFEDNKRFYDELVK